MIIVWFFLTALVYASAGFGGGSTYTAILVLSDVDHRVLPIVSLACNLIVVSGSCWRFHQLGQMAWRRTLPLLMASVPMAVVGGALPIDRHWFVLTLGTALFVAGVLLLFVPAPSAAATTDPSIADPSRRRRLGREALLGGALGLLSGLVGIGGGIFLSPVLHLIGWAQARTIAATSSLFIFVNSAAGLLGQLGKIVAGADGEPSAMANCFASVPFWPWLLLAVWIGGQIGNRATTRWFSQTTLRRVTAIVVLLASGRLLWVSVVS